MTTIARRKVREKAALAKKHRAAFARFFRMQGLMVLEKLESLQHRFPAKAGPLPKAMDQAWMRIWEEIDRDTFDELQDIVTKAEESGLLAGGQLAEYQFINPTGKFWDLKNPRAVAWFRQNGGSVQYIKDIQDTTKDQIQTVIANALDTGQSYQKTAQEIRATFDGFTRERAQRIAVFETGKSYEAGNRALVDEISGAGIEMQERWVTSHDDKVRPEHAANEAEGWQPLNHVYSSGDTEPPTDPGCRCYKEYRQAVES
jgi:hypothetical protein